MPKGPKGRLGLALPRGNRDKGRGENGPGRDTRIQTGVGAGCVAYFLSPRPSGVLGIKGRPSGILEVKGREAWQGR